MTKQNLSESNFYISITGLRLKRSWHYPRFMWHAVGAMAQAKRAPGCLSAQSRTINGVQHTLSVWESDEAMRTFLYSGAHMKAIKAFRTIATGRTFGFWSDQAPEWSEVHQLWLERGREY